MRLPTELWVKAYLRRLQAAGIFAAVVRKGDPEHGTLWIKVSHLDGRAVLFGPAPEPLDAPAPDRRFLRMHKAPTVSDAEADANLARAREFDSDLWLVEVEDRDGRHCLDDAVVGPS